MSEMINMVLKSESTNNNDKKAENMWNDCSYDTGAFTKLNQMEKNGIEGASGTQLSISLTVFSTWIQGESELGLYGQKNIIGFQKSCQRILENFVLCWKGTFLDFCKVLKNQKYDTWMKD